MGESNFNLQDKAYQIIIKKILHNEYCPGQKISQTMIEKELALGRTPVREALLRLKREGLIYTVPQSGTFVTKIDLSSVTSARFVREILERKIIVEAASLDDDALLAQDIDNLSLQEQYAASGRYQDFFEADDAFHRAFFLVTNHSQAWEWLQIINTQFNRFRWLRLGISELPWATLIDQHKEILTAVNTHNIAGAELAVTKHLQLMFEEEQIVIKTYPEYFQDKLNP